MEISTLGGFWFLQSPVRCLGVNALKTALGEVLADSAEKAAPNREGPGRQGRGAATVRGRLQFPWKEATMRKTGRKFSPP